MIYSLPEIPDTTGLMECYSEALSPPFPAYIFVRFFNRRFDLSSANAGSRTLHSRTSSCVLKAETGCYSVKR